MRIGGELLGVYGMLDELGRKVCLTDGQITDGASLEIFGTGMNNKEI